ncbi:NAD-glutamate dehydrogenase [Luteococcus peritonei]|uniref:NAD-glutamate dehydrogenase n=1 Tax=Luteococcus peritonei TaxID=88874 RepID=A0ABW4RRF7_9ACTN
MPGRDARDSILDHLTDELQSHGSGLRPERLRPLVASWLLHVRDEDLAALDPEVLGRLLARQLELGTVRAPQTDLVRVDVPDAQAAGASHVQVVTDDRRFVVDTIAQSLTNTGWTIVELLHPQFAVVRDDQGRLVRAELEDLPEGISESWVGVLATPPLGSDQQKAARELEALLAERLQALRLVVEDFEPMARTMATIADELESAPAATSEAERDEAVALLRYLHDDHFTFLGYREYELADGTWQPVPGTGLGIQRGNEQPDDFNAVPTRDKVLLVAMTKDVRRAPVHRNALMDYIGVRSFDEAGRPVRERRFLGLLGQRAYTESVRQIGVLRAKAEKIVADSGFEEHSHGAEAIWSVLDTFPRDELFQATAEELEPIVAHIMQLKERRQVRLFVRPGRWSRRLTALVYFPRDRYNTAVRERMMAILKRATGATSIEYQARVSESVLARLVFTLETPSDAPEYDVEEVQRQLTAATHHWDDDFVEQARALVPSDQRGIDFPDSYKEVYTARQGLADLRALNRIDTPAGMSFAMYAPDDAEDISDLRLKVMRVGAAMQLQDVMPHLASLGVRVTDERPFEVVLRGEQAMVYDFGLGLPGGREGWDEAARHRFTEAFEASWQGRTDVDALNALVSEAGFTWREVLVLRAVARYLQQLGSGFSIGYVAQALRQNVEVARLLVELFRTRFDPDLEGERSELTDQVREQITEALDGVEVLDHDRILRQFAEVIMATVRTNHYSSDAPALALKLLPREISVAPQPRPEFEIFVHSPRIEGVHLRFGQVARGGLRWSDRPEDFRTEVLGLVKAQMVKNTVIVPVGAKGGFFARQLPNPATDRAAWLEEGKACYRLFIGSLLSVTDNIVDSRVVGPKRVVRHDADDPYLVVAADKGTATFSDIANQIAVERRFWLGDAFASGGSVGYDHKAMGITARGAWESVKHHFRELGLDCQEEDFTCVGIGDMSGDVFGNGMMLSRHTRLVAAFNHLHVFVDPDPDAERSYEERVRLFNLPRSTWADYDASLISEGGGVFPRSAKSVEISPQMREALGIAEGVERMTPTELIRACLAAPVDLLWNGGIGTYVKGSKETNQEVGDKANDAVRLDGGQIRAKVAGEGGNLGWTQLGRIEYALKGGRINTDFIDNSAGVDTSDHEVNIKILLDNEVAAGRLDKAERDALLPQMTDDVASLVLSHNVDQNLALANARQQAPDFASTHEAWMTQLTEEGYLDRAIEAMPTSATMRQRISDGRGLSGPELATLLAWSKIWLADRILASDLPDDPFVADRLVQYFPPLLRERYRDRMGEHRLHREIITTVAVNRFVNSQGMTACHRLCEETGAEPADVVRAQLAARSIFDAGRVEVNTKRAAMSAQTQTEMRLRLRHLVERGTRWLLHRNPGGLDIQQTIDTYHDGVQQLFAQLPELLTDQGREADRAQLDMLVGEGVDQDLATVAVGAQWAHLLPACVAIAQEQDKDLVLVAKVFFQLAERLGLGRLLARIEQLPRTNRWDTMARSAIRDDMLAAQSQLAAQAVQLAGGGQQPDEVVEAWWQQTPGVEQRSTMLGQIMDSEPDLARMSVGLRTVRALVA